jgi:DNA-directed RNA polymerase specialized sigma24 family protein
MIQGWSCHIDPQAVGTAVTAVDDQVVERTRAGDAVAWRALVDRHLPMVRAICVGYGLDDVASAAVNQVVWLRLAEHLPRIRTADAIGGWLAATTRSECVDPRRSAARSGWIAAALTLDGTGTTGTSGLPGHDGQSTGVVTGSAMSAAVGSAFGRLGARCQRLLRLLLTVPCPHDDAISAALDIAGDQIDLAGAECVERLARMLAADPATVREELQQLVMVTGAIPRAWEDAAAAAFAWVLLDVDLAELVYDSTVPAPAPEDRRRVVARPLRRVRFAAAGTGLELAVDTNDDEVLLTGRLAPARVAQVTARWPNGARAAGSGSDGAFRLDRLPVGPLCLHVDGAAPFKTGWIIP